MSSWTEQRLQRLFARYKRRFWAGRLPEVRVRILKLKNSYGEYDAARQEIRIDTDRHANNDREIRSTLLHEMAHVAGGRDHDSKFYFQVESLLRQGAPIAIGFSETDGLQIVKDAVPSRFPLARRLLNKAHERQQRRLEAQAQRSIDGDVTLTDEDLAQEFSDPEIAVFPWKRALWIVGSRYGLLDVDRRPKNRRSTAIISRGKKLHYKIRREILETMRRKRLYHAIN